MLSPKKDHFCATGDGKYRLRTTVFFSVGLWTGTSLVRPLFVAYKCCCACIFLTELFFWTAEPAKLELSLVVVYQLDIPCDPLMECTSLGGSLEATMFAQGHACVPICPTVRLLVAPTAAQRMF